MAKIKMLMSAILLVLVAIFLWCTYSLFCFDGFYQPTYLIGLSNPYEYYQKHIGSKLERYGQEYDVAESNTSQWNIYRNLDDGFEFKYPKQSSIHNIARDDYRNYMHIIHDDQKRDSACEIGVEFKGWKLGEHGLPGKRYKIDLDIENNRLSELWFMRDQYNGVVGVASTRFSGEKMDINFTGVTFIREDGSQFLHVVDYGNTCDEVTIKGIIATFRFID